MLSMPVATGVPLVRELQKGPIADGTVSRIWQLIARDEATLLAAPLVLAQTGPIAVSSSGPTIIIPRDFHGRWGGVSTHDGQVSIPRIVAPRLRTFRSPVFSMLDLAWDLDSRNTGPLVEAVPTAVDDDGTISLNLHVCYTSYLGSRPKMRAYTPPPETITRAPQFRVRDVAITARFLSGAWSIIYSGVTPPPNQSIEIFLIRATATKPTP
jgi:hypothetical protein